MWGHGAASQGSRKQTGGTCICPPSGPPPHTHQGIPIIMSTMRAWHICMVWSGVYIGGDGGGVLLRPHKALC